MVASPFAAPQLWRDDDLIGVSRAFDADLVLAAYRAGVFPMPSPGGLMGWYSPLERGVLPLDGLVVSRSLRRSRRRYRIGVDTAFDQVIAGCADRRRPHGWITGEIAEIYGQLFAEGTVHSVEAWTADGELAGGLYGVSVGGLFAGESMFHRDDIGRDASKVALAALVELLGRCNPDGRLLDVQWQTPHLASLGVIEIPRYDYLGRLAVALAQPTPDWAELSATQPARA